MRNAIGSILANGRRKPASAESTANQSAHARSPGVVMTTPAYSPGLEGVVAGETAICTVEGGLSYRGYAVGDLAEHCSFDEVAHLLLFGELPTAAQLTAFQAR